MKGRCNGGIRIGLRHFSDATAVRLALSRLAEGLGISLPPKPGPPGGERPEQDRFGESRFGRRLRSWGKRC